MKILLVSSSARGHALADALARSSSKPEIIGIAPSRNPGIKALAADQYVTDINDLDSVLDIAKKSQPELAIIGPEDPICLGLADALEEQGIATVAPKKAGAQVEGSKGFTRDLCEEFGIDCSPLFRVFTGDCADDIRAFIENDLNGNYVVKYDALKGGKGVKVSEEHLNSIDEGVAYAMECIAECGRVVVEEKLIGPEFSLISFVSGTQVADTPAVQDHKRAFEGDTGPNTGGMGTYSDANHSLPFLEDSDVARAKEINREVAKALQSKTGQPYQGILYGGFIATKRGVQLIEYNCRFGDPEALNILPLLESDFVDICQAIVNGDLSEDSVKFLNQATVCKYITPESYPTAKDQKGQPVEFPEMPDNARIFYGDLNETDDGSLELGGSRTAGIVGMGSTIEEAEKIAQELCEKVTGPVRFRSDIGKTDLIQKRVDLVKSIR